MPSTFSTLKIQLMATGENNTTWGDVTNLNLGTALEEAIVGSADVTFASADVTLTLTDTNASQTARNMRLRCTGTTGGSTRNLIVPAIEKPYIVSNDCADSIIVKNTTGTGITVPTGKTMWVYNNATNVVDAVTNLSSLTLGAALPVLSGGTGVTTSTGTVAVVLSNSPTLVTPVLGAASATSIANALGAVGTPSYTFTGDLNTGMWSPTTDTVAFSTNGSERVRVISTGEVGVGITNPSYPLAVASNASGGTIRIAGRSADGLGTLEFSSNGQATTQAYIQAGSTPYLLFGTSTTERMRIDSSGNVGIGNSAPTARLHVFGNNGTFGTNSFFGLNGSTSGIAIGNNGTIGLIQGQATALSATAADIGLQVNGGNVGIGTSSPGTKLDVSSSAFNIVASRSTGGYAAFQRIAPTGQQAYDFYTINGVEAGRITVDGANFMAFATGSAATERMRIDSSGNLLVGTTGAVGTLTVIAPASTTAAYLQTPTTTTWATRIVNAGATGDNFLVLFETDTGSQRGSVTYNRTAGLIQYNTTSDYRAKEVYGPVVNSGEAVDALKVYTGKMHGATIERPMLVAHEAKSVAPYSVTGEKDAVNEDGSPNFQQIDHSTFIPLLIAEIQSLRARVAQLEGN